MSPTVQTLLIGFATLAVFLGVSKVFSVAHSLTFAIYAFFAVWFIYCVWHMSVGMSHGYSFISELPFLALNFGGPALVGWLIYKHWSGQ